MTPALVQCVLESFMLPPPASPLNPKKRGIPEVYPERTSATVTAAAVTEPVLHAAMRNVTAVPPVR